MEGYILAGGMSRRMGTNKAGLCLSGRTFLERSAEALGAVARTVRIVGDLKGVNSDLHVIPDIAEEGSAAGSIIGLLTALQNAEDEWTAILAVDLPFVTAGLMIRLAEVAGSDPAAACVVPIQNDGRVQPLCGLYRTSESLSTVDEHYRNGEWRLRFVIQQLKTRYVSFEELEDLPGSSKFFFNVNTPLEYEKALEYASSPIP